MRHLLIHYIDESIFWDENGEQMAGYGVLERADLKEAIETASRHPTAKIGTFELRPFLEWPRS
jgi:hypothetical protein